MKREKNKHMQLDDRIEIQECLYKGMTFKAIAERIGKDPTTVYLQIIGNRAKKCPKPCKDPQRPLKSLDISAESP